MKTFPTIKVFGFLLVCFAAIALELNAGQSRKWKDVPEAVRATVLAHGGKEGTVDKEGQKIHGKTVYEAVGKDENGNQVDLVITEDGKLVTMKYDDENAAGQPPEATSMKSAAAMKFTHPRDVTNPYLPLATLKQDILEGTEDGKKIRIERTAMPDKRKTFHINGQEVESFVLEDREFEDGQLAEVALDYIAQSDDGTVYYLGEDVDSYKDGKITDHEGAWLLGKDTQNAGVLMPAHPKVGDKFKSEDVSKEIHEEDDVVAAAETVKTPAGTYKRCLKVREKLADGAIEYKYFAAGVGCVREVPEHGDVLLKSHKTISTSASR